MAAVGEVGDAIGQVYLLFDVYQSHRECNYKVRQVIAETGIELFIKLSQRGIQSTKTIKYLLFQN